MRASIIIARKELLTFFDSLAAYILLVAFLAFTGFFTWLNGNHDVFFAKQASLYVFFYWAQWVLFFFIPAITMRTLAEENKTGTIELLLTKPVTNWQVIWGKFMACFALIAFALLCTLPYYITIINLGKADSGVIFCGYIDLLLFSSAYISIGLFASSITNNQIVAFLITLVIGVFFFFLFGLFAGGLPENGLGGVLNYLDFASHNESLSRGVIDSRDLVYFGSIILMALILAETSLAKRSISE